MHFNPSEWMEFFDPRLGWYRYRHAGSGIIRDSLFSPEPLFAKPQKIMKMKKATETVEKGLKTEERVPEKAEKGHKTIRQILSKKPRGQAAWQLTQILAKRL